MWELLIGVPNLDLLVIAFIGLLSRRSLVIFVLLLLLVGFLRLIRLARGLQWRLPLITLKCLETCFEACDLGCEDLVVAEYPLEGEDADDFAVSLRSSASVLVLD